MDIYGQQTSVCNILENGLDRTEQDNYLLAALLEFLTKHPDDEKILVSEDPGPTLKAKFLGIKTIKLEDSELVSDELDENEVRIKKLIRETMKYSTTCPAQTFSLLEKQST